VKKSSSRRSCTQAGITNAPSIDNYTNSRRRSLRKSANFSPVNSQPECELLNFNYNNNFFRINNEQVLQQQQHQQKQTPLMQQTRDWRGQYSGAEAGSRTRNHKKVTPSKLNSITPLLYSSSGVRSRLKLIDSKANVYATASKRRNSDGQSSKKSTSSCSSLSSSHSDYEQVVEASANCDNMYKSSEITHLFSAYASRRNKSPIFPTTILASASIAAVTSSKRQIASSQIRKEQSKLTSINSESYLKAASRTFDIKNAETSTPVRKTNRSYLDISSHLLFESPMDGYASSRVESEAEKPTTFYECDYDYSQQQADDDSIVDFYNNAAIMTLDQSTQVPVDAPVLLESTFDTSSCSNLSDDLIILQTATPAAPITMNSEPRRFGSAYASGIKQQRTQEKPKNTALSKKNDDWNLLVINKFANDTDATFDQLPDWAIGKYQLFLRNDIKL
jgi:hypothetical protein